MIVKYKKPIKQRYKEVNYIIIGSSIIVLGLMYLVGLYTGFTTTFSIFSNNGVKITRWLLIVAVVIGEELVRYLISFTYGTNKKRNFINYTIMLLCFILIDMAIAPRVYQFNNYYQICEFFCLFFVQSVSKNIFLCFITKDNGYIPCLRYRILIDLYIYIIPIKPEISLLIESITFLVLPYILYLLINPNKKRQARKEKIKFNLWSTLEISFIVVVIMLVSCQFKYGMLAIGSKSMTGTINKGDAIIYERYNEDDRIEEGQIIVFNKNNLTIVHRVVEIYPLSDGGELYQTKGDANELKDSWLVSKEDIIGTVNTRVMWVAWPTIVLNEIFF